MEGGDDFFGEALELVQHLVGGAEGAEDELGAALGDCILAVNEGDDSLGERLRGHGAPRKKITPPEAFRRVEWGASAI